MKKLWARVLSGVLAVMCLFAVVGCAPAPKLNIEKAADNLEDEDYTVMYTDDEDELGAALGAFSLPSQAGVAVEEMLVAYSEDGDDMLVIIKFETLKAAKMIFNQKKMEKKYQIESIKDKIEMYKWFAKKYDDDLSSKEIDAIEDAVKEWKDELKDMKKESVLGMSGKYVWIGTKDAIKDSK